VLAIALGVLAQGVNVAARVIPAICVAASSHRRASEVDSVDTDKRNRPRPTAAQSDRRVSLVTIKAVVFDAYGTLYDIQSVAAVTEEAFPGYGEVITQVWRIKQLEYTWLRSLMRRYEDFSVVTRESLAYTLRCLGLKYDEAAFARVMDKYLHLDLYPDAPASLSAMKDRKLAILSNGSPDMLNALVKNSGLDRVLDATISIDANRIFKPSPEAYTLIESTLHIPPSEVLFISSNPWDACGAKAFGLNVAWIERVTPEAMAQACVRSDLVAPLTMFKAIRTQMDELGLAPDHRIHALSELPDLVARS
jgi:2-haloacid dehalogenase